MGGAGTNANFPGSRPGSFPVLDAAASPPYGLDVTGELLERLRGPLERTTR